MEKKFILKTLDVKSKYHFVPFVSVVFSGQEQVPKPSFTVSPGQTQLPKPL